MDLNNRRTGKDATKPRALGLLGHSEHMQSNMPNLFRLGHSFFNFSFNGKRRLHIFNIKNKNKSVFFVLHF